jgi:hypothetical protein
LAPGAAFEEGVVVPDPLEVDPLDVDPLDVEPVDVLAVVETEGVVVEVLLVVALASAELSPKLKPNAPAAIPATKSGFFR